MHSYDHPWAGGAGKNKYNVEITEITNTGFTSSVVERDSANNFKQIVLNGSAAGSTFIDLKPTESRLFTLPAGTYILSGAANANAILRLYNSQGSAVASDNGSGITFTSDGTTQYYLQIRVEGGYTCTNLVFKPMIRLASVSDSTFVPYTNICPISGRASTSVSTTDGEDTESVSIAFGTTVYGGTVNFNTGVVTVDSVIADLGSLEWTYNSGDRRFNAPLADIKAVSVRTMPMKCSCYKVIDDGTPFADLPPYCIYNNGPAIAVHDAEYTDATAFTTAVTGQTVCYELATPTTLSLTPDILTMLKNNNSVSGDGVITITALTGDSWS